MRGSLLAIPSPASAIVRSCERAGGWPVASRGFEYFRDSVLPDRSIDVCQIVAQAIDRNIAFAISGILLRQFWQRIWPILRKKIDRLGVCHHLDGTGRKPAGKEST